MGRCAVRKRCQDLTSSPSRDPIQENQYGRKGASLLVAYKNGVYERVLGAGSVQKDAAQLAQEQRAENTFLGLLKRKRRFGPTDLMACFSGRAVDVAG
jgi:hypothetical protein